MEINNQIRLFDNELRQLRRDFHQYPELGCEKYRTADKISDSLSACGTKVQRITETGIVGLIYGKEKGLTLMLRTDMDALPVEEMTSLPYKSKNPGKMHACGHDGHMAMLLVAAKILSRIIGRFKGNIKLVFQPNEENMFAKNLVDKGVLDNPKVDAAFGLHLMTTVETSKIGIESGPVMAGMHTFRLTIIGQGGHTGFPQDSVDPIIVAANIIQTINLVYYLKIKSMNGHGDVCLN